MGRFRVLSTHRSIHFTIPQMPSSMSSSETAEQSSMVSPQHFLVVLALTVIAGKGFCQLHDFLTPEATQAMVSEARSLPSFRSSEQHNVFLEDSPEKYPAEHLRSRLFGNSKVLVAADTVPTTSPLPAIYAYRPLQLFLKEVLEIEAIHESADALGKFYYNVFEEGDELGWHFDRSPFSINLILQECQHGGILEFVPNTRDEWETLTEFPRETDLAEGAEQTELRAGSLYLFRGNRALHRVTPVRNGGQRINAICTYSETAGAKLNDYTLMKFFGRTE